MKKPNEILVGMCRARLDRLRFKDPACKARCEQLIPFELNRAIVDEYTKYAVETTGAKNVPIDQDLFELRIANKLEWAEDVAALTVLRCLETAKKEYEERPKPSKFQYLVAIVKVELEAHFKRIVSAFLVSLSAGCAYLLAQWGIIDFAEVAERIRSIFLSG